MFAINAITPGRRTRLLHDPAIIAVRAEGDFAADSHLLPESVAAEDADAAVWPGGLMRRSGVIMATQGRAARDGVATGLRHEHAG
jgi:hypothetical protein